MRNTLFGRTYLAIDRQTNCVCVLKVSYQTLIEQKITLKGISVLEDPRLECDLMRELAAAPSKHVGKKHILPLLDTMEDENFHWMALPYCRHGDFFDLVTQCPNGCFSESVARKYFHQLVLATQYMHEMGVCHMDLSLENLLLDNDLNLRVCDFGLARHLPPDNGCFANTNTVSDKQKPGKLEYMAPELFEGKPFDGRRADTYSMGVVLFMMLTGRPPFRLPQMSDVNFSIVQQHGLHGMRRLLEFCTKESGLRVSKELVHLLTSLLCRDSRVRPTLDEILRHPWLSGKSSSL